MGAGLGTGRAWPNATTATTSGKLSGMNLYITNEESAIPWRRQFIKERDDAAIVTVADKTSNHARNEGSTLLMWHGQAAARLGGEL